METYKFGNKVKCIIRFHNCSQTIGGITPQFDDQPYTVLNDISAEVSFKQNTTNSTNKEKGYLLSTDVSEISEIKLKNCLLTDKMIALIFGEEESQNFISQCQVTSDNGWLYLPTTKRILRAFVYNSAGEFIAAYGANSTVPKVARIPQGGLFGLCRDNCHFPGRIHQFNDGEDYKVFFEFEGDFTFSLDSYYTPVMSFDLISEGNLENSTKSFCLHIAKAAISPDKTFRFSDEESNTIDLTLKVIQPLPYEKEDGKINYLTVC